MLKNDKWIADRALKGMIDPFEPALIREIEGDRGLVRKVLSYGASSYGYDIRCATRSC
jgi:dCTP deaminase